MELSYREATDDRTFAQSHGVEPEIPGGAASHLGFDQCDQLPSTERVGLKHRGCVACCRGIETNPRQVGHQVRKGIP